MKKLRIGQIAPLYFSIPPHKYGGTEKIIDFLCDRLTKRGHEVFLFADAESTVNCNLIPILEKGLWERETQESIPYYAYEMSVVAKKIKELKLDILHDHLGPVSLSLYGQSDAPLVHTLHVPFGNNDRVWAYKKLNSNLVSISLNQRNFAPDLNYVANIYNGIDVENYPYNLDPENYFLWTGELSPRKGILEVIEIAEMAKIKLILAGRIPPPRQKGDFEFFEKNIKHRLNKGNVIYTGEKSAQELKEFYKNAFAFLFPLQWEEPFGLTMVEAMACGTPVIAYDRGSVSEVVKDGVTGYVVDPLDKDGKTNLQGFAEALKNIGNIKRKECRKWVEDNFSVDRMVSDYEKCYYKILNLNN